MATRKELIYYAIHHQWDIRAYKEVNSYLLNWKTSYLFSQVFPDDTYLTHNGVRYEMIKVNNINNNCKKVALSFRSFENINIVLIKGIY